jgi:superfamily II DNA or RNA helicase
VDRCSFSFIYDLLQAKVYDYDLEAFASRKFKKEIKYTDYTDTQSFTRKKLKLKLITLTFGTFFTLIFSCLQY